MLIRLHGTVLFLVAALVGCAGVHRPSDNSLMVRPGVAELVAFELSGRLSVRHGESSYVANIDWQHDAAHDEIFLSSPLGQGLAQLSRDSTGARLITGDQRRIEAPDWNGLAAQALGAELPLGLLPRWLVADVPPGARRDVLGRPLSFHQDGWTVTYSGYLSEEALALPQLIDARRQDMEIRLKVDNWQRMK